MRYIGRPIFSTHTDIRNYINDILNKSGMLFEDLYLYPEEVDDFTEEEKLDLMLLTKGTNAKTLRIYVIDPDTKHICDYFEDIY